MNQLWKAAGAAAWGAAAYSGLRPFLGREEEEKLLALCPHPRTVLVAAFPYYAGREPGNLSLYCRGEDYHAVLTRRLDQVCQALAQAHPGFGFHPGADNSPIPELAAAELAGVGHPGRHGLRIVPPYGSFVFLGTILTDLELPPTPSAGAGKCPDCCNACIRACPTGALTEGGCDKSKCLSELSQQKGDLTPEQEAQLKNSSTVWGCDLCQLACPQNRNLPLTPLPEFRENLKPALTSQELEGMSNKRFRKEYGDKAFAWRGIAPLKRNLALKGE